MNWVYVVGVDDVQSAEVPEPTSLMLLGSGLAWAGRKYSRRRREI